MYYFDTMKILFVFVSLISILLGAPVDNNSSNNHYENDLNETLFQITTPQDTEKDGNISRWVVLMTPRIFEDDSPQINTIHQDPISKTKETENELFTVFEPYLDPSTPGTDTDIEDFNPLKTILSSLFSFQPWSWAANNNEGVIEKYSPTEPTPALKVTSNKDELPETLVLQTPPTIEIEKTTESVSENEIEISLTDDLKSLDAVEKLAMKLEEKENVEFILDDESDLEFYRQQLELLKSMESTLLKLKIYFDKETETQEKLLDKSWTNSLVIASVGIIYLLLIFALFSFKSLFEADREQKDDSVLDHPHPLPSLITEKSVIQCV